MSLTLDKLIYNVLCTKLHTTSKLACTKNLLNMEGLVCKLTNSQPRVMLSQEDNTSASSKSIRNLAVERKHAYTCL